MADLYTALQPHIDHWRQRLLADALLHTPSSEHEGHVGDSGPAAMDGAGFVQGSFEIKGREEGGGHREGELEESSMGFLREYSEEEVEGGGGWQEGSGGGDAGEEPGLVVRTRDKLASASQPLRLAIVGLPNVVGLNVGHDAVIGARLAQHATFQCTGAWGVFVKCAADNLCVTMLVLLLVRFLWRGLQCSGPRFLFFFN